MFRAPPASIWDTLSQILVFTSTPLPVLGSGPPKRYKYGCLSTLGWHCVVLLCFVLPLLAFGDTLSQILVFISTSRHLKTPKNASFGFGPPKRYKYRRLSTLGWHCVVFFYFVLPLLAFGDTPSQILFLLIPGDAQNRPKRTHSFIPKIKNAINIRICVKRF